MSQSRCFEVINRAYNRVFQPERLSLGLVVPLEHYENRPVPTMQDHLQRVQRAEGLGFSAVWLRDIPFNVASFGDAGQVFDPFVYLGYLAGQTHDIALGVASVVLPLRHPAHVAKSAASVDVLSNGRVLLGIASGDRPDEYPALNMPFEERGQRFRESYQYIRRMSDTASRFDNAYGHPHSGMDMLPKPIAGKLPLMITGASQQDPQWLAMHGDGWITYPRDVPVQAQILNAWRARIEDAGLSDKPAAQSLYVDLVAEPDAVPEPIHLGTRCGTGYLKKYLQALERIGINHVAINLRFNQENIDATLQRLADEILPSFTA